jgi:starch synthase (maltosyl-transferring)
VPGAVQQKGIRETDARRWTAMKIYHLHPLVAGPVGQWSRHLAACQAMGFDHVGSAPLFKPGACGDIFLTGDHDQLHPALGAGSSADAAISRLCQACASHGLELILDLVIDRVDLDSVIRARYPQWFDEPAESAPDPRVPIELRQGARARFGNAAAADYVAWWTDRLTRLARAGVAGFRCLFMDRVPPEVWRLLIEQVHVTVPQCKFVAWVPGLSREAVARLQGIAFHRIASSLAWWDGRATWLVEETQLLRQVAPLVASPEPSWQERLASRLNQGTDPVIAYRHALKLAAATADGIFVPMGFEYATPRRFDTVNAEPSDLEQAQHQGVHNLSQDVTRALELTSRVWEEKVGGAFISLTGPGQNATILLRTDAAYVPDTTHAIAIVLNPDLSRSTPCPRLRPLPPSAGVALNNPQSLDDNIMEDGLLAPGEVRVLRYGRAADVVRQARTSDAVETALAAARVAIETVTPCVDNAAFAVKRVVGAELTVQADIICDGHGALAADLLWKPADATEWCRIPMRLIGNDRWEGTAWPRQVGRHVFTVEAWYDEWQSFREDLTKRIAAGQDVSLELEEGRRLLLRIAEQGRGVAAPPLRALASSLADGSGEERLRLILSDAAKSAVDEAGLRPFVSRYEPAIPVDVDRPQAAFGSWYEMFPRSATDRASRHGSFADVVARLPAIRDLGFDVLYFPPIHPIGHTNRKGRNNSLTCEPDDPGSPYAIGSADGGHDAIHPLLGTFDDFTRLVSAARDFGMEIALDYAVQCSPDHPWLRQHPDWFRYRLDGSVRYAENPPKKYEDIVNVEFYNDGSAGGVWTALRDIVLFWIAHGVRIFRVDNPHTKPLPFWEWMIADVRAQAPDVIFLSEAFTRPKMMYRLAKIGFTQSYTYFTWRNGKQEITDYLTELTSPSVRDFFRPNFFVNTPDINPIFLQTSGRAGFLIRAALATTLSGLWGMYSGFELCESAPLPDREEYLDAEKYEIRPRDFTAPGNIVSEITALNRLRKLHPALQTHLDLRFYNAFNDQVLLYGKGDPRLGEMILAAVSLDPHHPQVTDFEIPLWEWGLPDDGSLAVEDLLRGHRFVWTGKMQNVLLDPTDLPYRLWRISPMTV